MKTTSLFGAGILVAALLAGCETVPPGVERGPHGTIAYDVLVEASDPGARIEADGNDFGVTPAHVKIYGDKDGTFHDFGSYYYVIRAFPLTTNQFPQTRYFGTGRNFSGEDKIPNRIYFDMNQNTPNLPPPAPIYVYPPPYYEPYYGPSVRFYYGPRYHRRW